MTTLADEIRDVEKQIEQIVDNVIQRGMRPVSEQLTLHIGDKVGEISKKTALIDTAIQNLRKRLDEITTTVEDSGANVLDEVHSQMGKLAKRTQVSQLDDHIHALAGEGEATRRMLTASRDEIKDTIHGSVTELRKELAETIQTTLAIRETLVTMMSDVTSAQEHAFTSLATGLLELKTALNDGVARITSHQEDAHRPLRDAIASHEQQLTTIRAEMQSHFDSMLAAHARHRRIQYLFFALCLLGIMGIILLVLLTR